MRDKLMAEVISDYEAFKAAESSKPSYRKPKGPHCPRCAGTLTKKKPAEGKAFYECRRHGFVRHVLN